MDININNKIFESKTHVEKKLKHLKFIYTYLGCMSSLFAQRFIIAIQNELKILKSLLLKRYVYQNFILEHEIYSDADEIIEAYYNKLEFIITKKSKKIFTRKNNYLL